MLTPSSTLRCPNHTDTSLACISMGRSASTDEVIAASMALAVTSSNSAVDIFFSYRPRRRDVRIRVVTNRIVTRTMSTRAAPHARATASG